MEDYFLWNEKKEFKKKDTVYFFSFRGDLDVICRDMGKTIGKSEAKL